MEDADQPLQEASENEGARKVPRSLVFFSVQQTFRLLRWIVVAIAVVVCFQAAAENFKQLGQAIGDMPIDRWILILILVFGSAGTAQKLRAVLRGIGREHDRVKDLEGLIDPHRSSSGLTEEGESPKGDLST